MSWRLPFLREASGALDADRRPFFTSRERVPAQPWRRRLVEVGRIVSLDSDRSTIWLQFAPVLLLIGVPALVGRPDRWPGALALTLLGVAGTYALVRLADERCHDRDQLRAVWTGPRMADVAARYRLDLVEPMMLPTSFGESRLLRPPTAPRRAPLELGQWSGTVRERDASVLGFMTARGEVVSWQAAALRLRRPGIVRIQVGGRPGRRAEEEATFEQLFRAKGEDAATLPPELRSWLAATCRELEFEVLGGWVLCRRAFPWRGAIDPDEVGVLLAAVVGFADRWDAG